jgi:hypothetical protein
MTQIIIMGIVTIIYIAIACYLIEIEERADEKLGKLTKSDLRELVRGDFFSEN